MDKGIAVAGSLIADTHYAILVYPEEERLADILDIHTDVGGTGNIIIDLAKMDPALPIRASGIAGHDEAGNYILSILSAYQNIDTRNISREGKTSTTLVMDAQNTKKRTFFHFPGTNDIYGENFIDWTLLDADIFHLEYLLLMKKLDETDSVYGTHAAKILCEAQKRGMKTSIDMVSKRGPEVTRIVRAALKYTDFCVINELEAAEVTGIPLDCERADFKENAAEALYKLAGYGVSQWVLIHSASCSFGLDCKTKKVYALAGLNLPVDYIKGKVGAGDAYCAGVLYAAYKEQSIIEAMKLGTATACCSLSEMNGTDGLRPYEQICAFYEKHKGENDYEAI